uniref:Apolipoprotein A-IV a n=1 Tax=Kryptolebias marmoratus TaxID=37003 RepID=A0A3Q3AKE2_KRYMA
MEQKGLVYMCCIDFLAQGLSTDRRVRQGDSKALPLGLWDHYFLACYISSRISPVEHKHNQVDLQIHLQTQGPRAMKVLAVLVLAVFTGCNGNLFYADAPKPQLEVMTDAFWDYVGKATQTADDTLQMIKKSQIGQDISARLTESADMANKYAVSLQEQLPPGAQDMINKFTTEADMLKERVTQELNTAQEKLQPYTENIKTQLQQRVEQLKQELAPYADTLDSEALRSTLMQKSEELKMSLEQSVKDLQAQLVPYTDDLRSKLEPHLEEFKQRATPMTERVQSELTQTAQQRDYSHPALPSGKQHSCSAPSCSRICTVNPPHTETRMHAHTHTHTLYSFDFH